MEHLSRTSLILGEDAVRALRNCRVAIFGVGKYDEKGERKNRFRILE